MTDVRVLLVDDQAPFRRAMSAAVEETHGFEVIGEADSGEQCVEATSRLRARPSPPVVVLLSTFDEDAGTRFVAWCGAAEYVTRSAFGPDRLRAVWATASA